MSESSTPARALAPGQQLSPTDPAKSWAPNQGLVSPNNQYQLQYQNDGNLVLYQQVPGPQVRQVVQNAATNTDLSQYFQSYAEIMPNGQFAILHESAHGNFTIQWCVKGEPGSSLCLADDGSLYLQVEPNGQPIEVDLTEPSTDCVAP